MSLSVERAGVMIAHLPNVGAEVDVLCQLGVDGVLSAVVHDVAELLPVVCRGYFVAVLFGEVDAHLLVGCYGGR